MPDLRRRIRNWTLFFIVGLVISGATAVPLPTEVRLAARLLGDDFTAAGRVPPGMAAWMRSLHDGVLLVRGIPGWWRLIDASFGIVGFVPLWLCHRWTGQLEDGRPLSPRPRP
jgi:hypothetical protein